MNELAALQIQPDAILIVENKDLAARITTHDARRHRDLPAAGRQRKLERYDQPDSTLAPAEASALAGLQLADGNYLRIEQERIPVSDAEHALEQAWNLVQPFATDPRA